MSFLVATPELVTAAATDGANVGSTLATASYAATEAASASPLQTLEQDVLGKINMPTGVLFGRRLIGNGTPGAGRTVRLVTF